MKILILSAPRVGGRNLSRWLSLELNYLWIHEPFHFHKESHIKNIRDLEENLNLDNIVVKSNFNDWKDFYTEGIFCSKFDKIICLTRKDSYDAAVSYAKALETNNFINPYTIEQEWINENSEEIKNHHEHIKKLMEGIIFTKDSLQITYEGVYYERNDIEKIKDFLELKDFKYSNMLNRNGKYRNNKREII